MRNTILRIFVLTILLPCAHVSAQDIVVKKDGNIIRAKVIEVDENTVKYKNFTNPDGPTYTIRIDNLLSITYENGQTETFSNSNPETKKAAPSPSTTQGIENVSKTVLEAQIADLESRASTIQTVGGITTVVASLGTLAAFVIATDGDYSFGNIMLGTGLLLAVDFLGIGITHAIAKPSKEKAAALKASMVSTADLSLQPAIMMNKGTYSTALGLNLCFRF